jgi:hypothetical protein
MGGAPKYSAGRARLRRWDNAKRYYESQNIMVNPGKGKYPKCLKEKPYPEICPKETPEDPKNVPKECRLCPQHLESPLYAQVSRIDRLRRLQDSGLPTKIVNKRL